MYKTDALKAYVTGFRYDVFVSYAHVDNVPLEGADKGWVTIFIKNLENYLARKLGRNCASIWIDHNLAGNAPLTPEIMNALHETATLVVIVSRGYIASEWCRREREAFLQLVGERANSRIFLVECDKVDKEELPNEFGDLLGYRFWVQDSEGRAPRTLGTPVPRPDEQEYYIPLNNLSRELALELERLKRKAESGNLIESNEEDSADRPSVFLAEVTEDLDHQRQEVKSRLLQEGLNVLPKIWYPHDDLIAYQRALDEDLAKCKLFIQLLSGVSGRKPPTWPNGYTVVQYERAKQAGKPILQWRNRKLDKSVVVDEGHRALLESDTVRESGIEEFKSAVVAEAKREPAPQKSPTKSHDLIFVNTDSTDRKLAQEVSQLLIEHGFWSVMPPERGEPSEIRRDLEGNLQDCDGLIIVYGEATATWVRNQLRQARKVVGQREQPLRCLAVCEGPPPEKDGLAFLLPHLHNLNCRNGLDDRALMEFIECLRRMD
jgi:hypothetical protein